MLFLAQCSYTETVTGEVAGGDVAGVVGVGRGVCVGVEGLNVKRVGVVVVVRLASGGVPTVRSHSDIK